MTEQENKIIEKEMKYFKRFIRPAHNDYFLIKKIEEALKRVIKINDRRKNN